MISKRRVASCESAALSVNVPEILSSAEAPASGKPHIEERDLGIVGARKSPICDPGCEFLAHHTASANNQNPCHRNSLPFWRAR